jgi:hypothetical protein
MGVSVIPTPRVFLDEGSPPPQPGARGSRLPARLVPEPSRIDLILTTIYHSLAWRREVRISFMGIDGRRGTVGRPLDTAASSMETQLDIGIEVEGSA